jgi:ribosome-associated protein
MNIEAKLKLIVAALEDLKAQDIAILNTSKLTALFERMVIASGSSNRQTRALADNVHVKVKEAGEYVGNTEGEDSGEWVLLDLGDVIVHVMLPAVRAHYNLEELWGAAEAARTRHIQADH